ncbi:MAG: hypothetical protein M3P06_14955 [Acidobacteriota bacterium]|nr:hypothetical protein [Acidobacteriota bacterium]
MKILLLNSFAAFREIGQGVRASASRWIIRRFRFAGVEESYASVSVMSRTTKDFSLRTCLRGA